MTRVTLIQWQTPGLLQLPANFFLPLSSAFFKICPFCLLFSSPVSMQFLLGSGIFIYNMLMDAITLHLPHLVLCLLLALTTMAPCSHRNKPLWVAYILTDSYFVITYLSTKPLFLCCQESFSWACLCQVHLCKFSHLFKDLTKYFSCKRAASLELSVAFDLERYVGVCCDFVS
jgi:hypothetical protein